MEITKVERLRRQRARYAISLDGARAFDVSEAIFMKFRLCTGDEIDPPLLRRIQAADTEMSAREIAINFLSYRPRSVREVVDHLQRKKIPRPLCQQVAARLEQLRLLNDEEFARMFVRDRLRQKRSGETLIRRQLLAKGITSEMIDRIFSETVSSADIEDACLQLAQRRAERTAASMNRMDIPKRKQRLTEFLLRRGFDYDVVQRAIRTLFP